MNCPLPDGLEQDAICWLEILKFPVIFLEVPPVLALQAFPPPLIKDSLILASYLNENHHHYYYN